MTPEELHLAYAELVKELDDRIVFHHTESVKANGCPHNSYKVGCFEAIRKTAQHLRLLVYIRGIKIEDLYVYESVLAMLASEFNKVKDLESTYFTFGGEK